MECDERRPSKAERTAADLRAAARVLACRKPIESITVDEIASEAGVSRRTFFNYFETKYHVFLPDITCERELLERIAAGDPPDVIDALSLVVSTFVFERLELRRRYPRYADELKRCPHVHDLFVARWHSFDAAIRAALAPRLGLDADEPAMKALSMAMLAIGSAILTDASPREWTRPQIEARIVEANKKLSAIYAAAASHVKEN